MLGRPERHEAADFHWNYIDQVQGDDVSAILLHQLTHFDTLFGKVSEQQSLYRYAPGKWSIRESMGHITDTERIFAYRTLWFARQLADPLPGFDQDIAVARAESDRISLADHLVEFREVRRSTLSLIRNLPGSAWTRSGTASGKTITVRAMAFVMAGHVEHHLKILRERYLA